MKPKPLILLALLGVSAGCASHAKPMSSFATPLGSPADASAPAGPPITTGNMLSIKAAEAQIAPPPLLLGQHLPGQTHPPAKQKNPSAMQAMPGMKMKGMNMPANGGSK